MIFPLFWENYKIAAPKQKYYHLIECLEYAGLKQAYGSGPAMTAAWTWFIFSRWIQITVNGEHKS